MLCSAVEQLRAFRYLPLLAALVEGRHLDYAFLSSTSHLEDFEAKGPQTAVWWLSLLYNHTIATSTNYSKAALQRTRGVFTIFTIIFEYTTGMTDICHNGPHAIIRFRSDTKREVPAASDPAAMGSTSSLSGAVPRARISPNSRKRQPGLFQPACKRPHNRKTEIGDYRQCAAVQRRVRFTFL